MPTINLTDDELAAVAAEIRRAIEDADKFPHARGGLIRLRAALARSSDAALKPIPHPKAPPPAKSRQAGAVRQGRPSLRFPPASSWAGCRPTADPKDAPRRGVKEQEDWLRKSRRGAPLRAQKG